MYITKNYMPSSVMPGNYLILHVIRAFDHVSRRRIINQPLFLISSLLVNLFCVLCFKQQEEQKE